MKKFPIEDADALIAAANEATKKLSALIIMFEYFEWHLPSLHVRIAYEELIDLLAKVQNAISTPARKVAL
jgi:hypothetical protein